jgi:hypothetical protein
MDWLDSMQTGLAAVGLKFLNVVVAAASSFVGLRFFNSMATADKWATFFGGWTIAVWGAAPLREWLEQKPSLEVGFVLLLGLFGMALTAEVIKVIRETQWGELLKSFLDWLLRRNPGGDK